MLPLEGWLAGVTVLILAVPAVVVGRAYAKVRTPRLLLAALGFTVFAFTDLAIFAANLADPVLADSLEWLEFAGDVATAGCFAAAFLLPTGA